MNAHPAQTDAVFFALAQGGLSGQVAKVTGPKKPVVPAAQIKVNEKQVNKPDE